MVRLDLPRPVHLVDDEGGVALDLEDADAELGSLAQAAHERDVLGLVVGLVVSEVLGDLEDDAGVGVASDEGAGARGAGVPAARTVEVQGVGSVGERRRRRGSGVGVVLACLVIFSVGALGGGDRVAPVARGGGQSARAAHRARTPRCHGLNRRRRGAPRGCAVRNARARPRLAHHHRPGDVGISRRDPPRRLLARGEGLVNRALDAVHLRARLVPGGVNAGSAAPSHAVEFRLSHGAGAACSGAPGTPLPVGSLASRSRFAQ